MNNGIEVKGSANVDSKAKIGSGTIIWDLAQIRENAIIGANCIVGRGAYIGTGVQVGDNVKVQNYALVYEPASLESGVFVGPGVIFTNDHNPRAVMPDGRPKAGDDWDAVGVHVSEGASIGARAVCIAPVEIGKWSIVAAGAVVTRDVGDFALVAGVPARRIGWVGRSGHKLLSASPSGTWNCPITGERYEETDGILTFVGDSE